MLAEDWKKVKEIFAEAVEMTPDDREKYLSEKLQNKPEVRQKVEQMLLADQTDNDVIDNPVLDVSVFWNKEKLEDLIGQKIGNYKILNEIGRGGMGVVFKAIHETEGVSHYAALKILKRGMDTEAMLRRFQNERKILASLEHPHIVRMLEAGMTDDNLPFYTMELIDGQSLDSYTKEKNPNLKQRLELFQQICAAISYAHGKLVIHRDLKPSNVLVTPDGTVKLLDFGIAKVISPDTMEVQGTATQLGIMTPRYASPEQIRGETVSVASDVYSLGIILYELLTGTLPYQTASESPMEIARIVCEVEPQKPSETNIRTDRNGKEETIESQPRAYSLSQLRGDLDTIILKSLQKESFLRYVSVEQLSNDISRYLNGLPIIARPTTLRYRAEKFIKRNRLAVGASAFIALALLIGAGLAVWQAIRAERQRILAEKQRALAEKNFNDVRELANKVVFRYHDEIAKLPGSTALREELVTDAVKYLDSLMQEDTVNVPLKLQIARTYRKVGDVQGKPYTLNLGKSDDALVSYQKSVEVLETALKIEPDNVEIKKELILSLLSEAQMGVRVDKAKKEELLNKCQQLQDEIGDSDPVLTDKLNRQANIYLIKGDMMEISLERIAMYQKAADLLKDLPEKTYENQMTFARGIQRMGTNYLWLGSRDFSAGNKDSAQHYFKLSLPFHQKYVEIVTTHLGDANSPITERRIAMGYQNLGEIYTKLNEFKLGFENLNRSLEMYQRYVNKNPDNIEAQIDISNCYFTIASAYEFKNDLYTAIEINQKSLEILNKVIALDANSELVQRKFDRLHRLVELFNKTKQPTQSQNTQKQLTEFCSTETNKPLCKKRY